MRCQIPNVHRDSNRARKMSACSTPRRSATERLIFSRQRWKRNLRDRAWRRARSRCEATIAAWACTRARAKASKPSESRLSRNHLFALYADRHRRSESFIRSTRCLALTLAARASVVLSPLGLAPAPAPASEPVSVSVSLSVPAAPLLALADATSSRRSPALLSRPRRMRVRSVEPGLDSEAAFQLGVEGESRAAARVLARCDQSRDGD